MKPLISIVSLTVSLAQMTAKKLASQMRADAYMLCRGVGHIELKFSNRLVIKQEKTPSIRGAHD